MIKGTDFIQGQWKGFEDFKQGSVVIHSMFAKGPPWLLCRVDKSR